MSTNPESIEWNDVSGVMMDMDGTVYKGNKVITGAPEFIGRLKARNIPFVFLTNNSSAGREHYFKKLSVMGFDVSPDDILTSTTATIRYILRHHHNSTVYPVGTPGFVAEIEKEGIVTDMNDPDIVLLSFDRTITYEKINKAYNFLKNGKTFIATHPDDTCPTEDGYDIDIGPFIRMFGSMTGAEAVIIGKPSVNMIKMAADRMGVPFERTVMIGDRICTDMKMAYDAKIRSVMVLSGEAQRSDLRGSDIRPTMIVDSVADLL